MSRPLRIVLSLLGLGLLLLSLQCVRSAGPALDSTYPVAAVDESQPGSSTTSPAPVELAEPNGPSQGTAAQLPGEPSETASEAATDPVARLMRSTDEHDRELLSSVERETGRAPSQALVDLVQRRQAGAVEAELRRMVDSQLQGDLRERMAAERWLRAVFPSSSAPLSPAPAPGTGGGERRLAPLQRSPK